MGPRLLSRGKNFLERYLDSPFIASMGPRLLSRGKGTPRHQHVIGRVSFNGAAAVEPRKEAAKAGGE